MSEAGDTVKAGASGALSKLIFWGVVILAVILLVRWGWDKIVEALTRLRDQIFQKPVSQDVNERDANDNVVGLLYEDDRAKSDLWDVFTFNWGESKGELTPYALQRQAELGLN